MGMTQQLWQDILTVCVRIARTQCGRTGEVWCQPDSGCANH